MLQISIRNKEQGFQPGSTISGTVAWRDVLIDSERIEIRLIWFTTGKGDRDVEIVHRSTIEQPQPEGETKFEFKTPNRPYSFSGKLISLTWAIEAVELPRKDAEKQELIISSNGREIELYDDRQANGNVVSD